MSQMRHRKKGYQKGELDPFLLIPNELRCFFFFFFFFFFSDDAKKQKLLEKNT